MRKTNDSPEMWGDGAFSRCSMLFFRLCMAIKKESILEKYALPYDLGHLHEWKMALSHDDEKEFGLGSRLVLEEILHVFVANHFLIEDVSTSLGALHHLDDLGI